MEPQCHAIRAADVEVGGAVGPAQGGFRVVPAGGEARIVQSEWDAIECQVRDADPKAAAVGVFGPPMRRRGGA